MDISSSIWRGFKIINLNKFTKNRNITIVGPRSVGKSTISKILSNKFNYKYVESDNLMHKEMKEYGGLDKVIKSGKIELMVKKGPEVAEKSLKQDKIVFDLAGGAISSRKGIEMGACQEIIKIVSKNSIIVGLLLFKNDEKSIKLLFQRERKRKHFKGIDSRELKAKVKKDYLKLKPILKKTSNFIIYTQKRNPESIADKIFQNLKNIK